MIMKGDEGEKVSRDENPGLISKSPNPVDDPLFRLVPPRGFEELAVGERFPLPSRTITEAMLSAFQAVSGDNHPLHYDRVYLKKHGHRDLLLHGFQVVAMTAPGAGLFPHVTADTMIGFIGQSSNFLKPVYYGDTVYPMLEISELRRQRTTGVVVLRSTVYNQKGELVLEGEQRFLMRLKKTE